MNQSPTQKRISGGGRPVVHPDVDDQLFEYFLERRSNGLPVHMSTLRTEGMRLLKGIDDSFKFSHGWYRSFCERYNLVMRSVTTSITTSVETIAQRCVSFYRTLQSTIRTKNLSGKDFVFFDETALWFGESDRETLDVRGSRHIPVLATVCEKFRITGIFGQYGNGIKLPPILLWNHNKDTIETRIVEGLFVIYVRRAWNNNLVMKHIINRWFVSTRMKNIHVVMDSAPMHSSRETIDFCQQNSLNVHLIPGGCTPYIQPQDVFVFSQLKHQLSQLVNKYIESTPLRTRSGKIPKPSLNLVAKWVNDVWKTFNQKDLELYCHKSLLCPSPKDLYIAQDHLGAISEKFLELEAQPEHQMPNDIDPLIDDFYHLEVGDIDDDQCEEQLILYEEDGEDLF